MVKFAGLREANAIAIRIARAASGKDNVAFCEFYHGWHDWYLATNVNKQNNLNNHLLKNLPTKCTKEINQVIFIFNLTITTN